MTHYWEHDSPFQPATKVRSDEANAKFDGIATSLEQLPSETELKSGTAHYSSDVGSANSYIVTLPYEPPGGYVIGLSFVFKAVNPNTGASVIDVNSLGNKSIIRTDGTELKANDILANALIVLIYDGSQFQFTGVVQSFLSEAKAWASEDEDVIVNGSDYSAKHYASKSAASASNADTSESNASTSASNALASADAAESSAQTLGTEQFVRSDQGDTLNGQYVINRNAGGDVLSLKDGDSTGMAANPLLAFVDGNDAALGYVGFGSASNNILYLSANSAGVILTFAGATKIETKPTGIDITGAIQSGTFSSTGVTAGTSIENGATNSSATSTAATNHLTFYNPNGAVGQIETSGSSTIYSTSSDYRLKQNVKAMDGAIDKLLRLRPVNFNFISEPSISIDGFIAHEVQEIMPEAVVGEKNGKKMQAIDHSKFVPLLTAALQDALKKINNLETRLVKASIL